jgi:Tfp pilus assembly protein PilZ
MRPGLRSLAPASPAPEAAVSTRAVTAVMGAAPTSIRVDAPSAPPEPVPLRPEPLNAPTDPPTKAPEPAPMRLEPAAAPPDPAPASPEPAARRPEPTLPPREQGTSSFQPLTQASQPSARVSAPRVEMTQPSPRLIEAQLAQPAPRVIEARSEMLSRPPAAVRRDVVIEHDLRAVDAPLGAHSPSNFYTGLSGGDVVASGGLFVATYQVPQVGEKVLLKISMPGGYEFIAKAKVAWTRDVATSLNPGSPRGIAGAPGFGAQFCEITEEGRRLIQRYVRNREPLFHEDAS